MKLKKAIALVTYLCTLGEIRVREFAFKPIFMYDPICFLSFRSSPFVENKGLLHPNKATFSFENLFIFSSCLPISRFSCSICSHPGRILPISLAKEVPFFLSHLSFLCKIKQRKQRLVTNTRQIQQQQTSNNKTKHPSKENT